MDQYRNQISAALGFVAVLTCARTVPDGYVGVVLRNSKVQPASIRGIYLHAPFVTTVLRVPTGPLDIVIPATACGTNGTLFWFNKTIAKVTIADPVVFVKQAGLGAIQSPTDAVRGVVTFAVTEYFSEFCSTLRPQDPMQANLHEWAGNVEQYLHNELSAAHGLSIHKYVIPRKPDAPNSSVDEDYNRQAQASSRVQAAEAERNAITAESTNVMMQANASINVQRQQALWSAEQIAIEAQANASAAKLLSNATLHAAQGQSLLQATATEALFTKLGPESFHIYAKYDALRTARATWVVGHGQGSGGGLLGGAGGWCGGCCSCPSWDTFEACRLGSGVC